VFPQYLPHNVLTTFAIYCKQRPVERDKLGRKKSVHEREPITTHLDLTENLAVRPTVIESW
jgi:hypothetical protein